MVRIYGLFYYPGPITTGRNYEISKGMFLYVSGKKPWPHPKYWRGQVVQVLYRKEGGDMDGA